MRVSDIPNDLALIVTVPLLLAAVAGLVWMLVRAILFPARKEYAKERARLRQPEPAEVAALVGFALPLDVEPFFLESPLVDQVEFLLVDRSKQPASEWDIASFVPLTVTDVRKWRRISKVSGVPIAHDFSKGTYVIDRNGSIVLEHSQAHEGNPVVAPSLSALAQFAREEILEQD